MYIEHNVVKVKLRPDGTVLLELTSTVPNQEDESTLGFWETELDKAIRNSNNMAQDLRYPAASDAVAGWYKQPMVAIGLASNRSFSAIVFEEMLAAYYKVLADPANSTKLYSIVMMDAVSAALKAFR